MAGAAAEDFNHRIIEEFRANGGRVGSPLAGTPVLLLHHIGARSGIERVTPLVYRPHGDGRYVIVASNGGSPTHPGWYHNLKANPVVEVEVGTETFTACAQELEATAHHPLWSELVAASASLREYQAKIARRIPMLMLTPLDSRSRTCSGRSACRSGPSLACRSPARPSSGSCPARGAVASRGTSSSA
jgi:deazaflavin-dependent oxidoreductase (nitroreductase family)